MLIKKVSMAGRKVLTRRPCICERVRLLCSLEVAAVAAAAQEAAAAAAAAPLARIGLNVSRSWN